MNVRTGPTSATWSQWATEQAVHLRPPDRDELGQLLLLWNDCAAFDPMTAVLFDEKILGDVDVALEDCVVAEIENDVAGFAVPVLRHTRDGLRGYVKLLAVATAMQGGGIGRTLLEHCENSLRRAGARTVRLVESAPNYLAPGIDSRNRGAIRFAEACGYALFAEACNLAVDLRDATFGVPAADVPDAGIPVRRAKPADQDAAQAFVGLHWQPWLREVAAAFANAPPTLYLAFDGDRVVGFAAYDANNRGTGWFGPMGVDPAVGGAGVGRELLYRCLADLQAQGLGTATIPWVKPVAFYEKCAGARLVRTFQRFEKNL